MSKYEDTINSDVMECPYCGQSYQPEGEDYSEDVREGECDSCGKKYYMHQAFTVDHYATPDCVLNGMQHDYQPIDLRNGKNHPFCTVCGKCQPHGELEKATS